MGNFFICACAHDVSTILLVRKLNCINMCVDMDISARVDTFGAVFDEYLTRNDIEPGVFRRLFVQENSFVIGEALTFALYGIRGEHFKCDIVCCPPTHAYRDSETIDSTIDLLKITAGLSVIGFVPKSGRRKRTQDLDYMRYVFIRGSAEAPELSKYAKIQLLVPEMRQYLRPPYFHNTRKFSAERVTYDWFVLMGMPDSDIGVDARTMKCSITHAGFVHQKNVQKKTKLYERHGIAVIDAGN